MNTFHDIKELISALHRERKLITEMFSKRTSLDYKKSDALALMDYDENRLDFLLQHEVVRENAGVLELDDQYLQFFEQVLNANEEINLSYIDENISKIKENIAYFLNESNASRKHSYLKFIKKSFRKIGLITLRSVVDLRRNIDNTFKKEPNYKNKQLKLKNLDEKRALVATLISQTLALINDDEYTFFNRALDEELTRIIVNLKFQLTECSHNLIEIEKQVIDYLNQIKYQGKFLEKLRKLKYLRDHFIIEAETNIQQILAEQNHVIFEKRIVEPLNLSLDYLRENEAAFEAIKRIAKNHSDRKTQQPVLANQISEDYLDEAIEEEIIIDMEEVRNQFMATSDHLLKFILNYDFLKEVSFDERITLFCQFISQYDKDLKFTDGFITHNNIECALVYPK